MRSISVSPGTWAALLALLGTTAAGCGKVAGESSARAETQKAAPATRVVTVLPERATVRRVAEQPGQIDPAEVTPIHAKLAGYVQSVSVDIGDRVKAGQLMAELRVPEVMAELKQKRATVGQSEAERRQAEAAVAVAQAELESVQAKVAEIRAGVRAADADVERWRAEFARVQQLAQDRALVGSLVDETRSKLGAAEASRDEVGARIKSAEAAIAQAKALLDKARSDVQAAASRVEVARFDSEKAEAMVGYMRIEAPYDGVVIRRKVDRGQLTTPGASADPLFVVARSDVVTISVGVPESDATTVEPGDSAQVRLMAMGGKTVEGKVTRTAWALDASTRTLLVEIDLPNPGEVLRPGLYAYATVVVDEHPDVLTVPSKAVVKAAGKAYCVLIESGRAKRREVQLGYSDSKRTEVISGLSEGDAVIESNAATLTDGQPVEAGKP